MPPPMITTLACDGMAGTIVSVSARRCAHMLTRQPHGELRADPLIDRLRHVCREVRCENLTDLLGSSLRRIERTLFRPFIRALAIADSRIEVRGLHQLQCLLGPEVVTWAFETHLPDGVERQAGVIDLDPADGPLSRADDVVVDDETFKREAEQTRVHAGGLVD